MVVRGGYGTYYNTSVYNTIANNMAQQPPFAQTLSIASAAAGNPLTMQNGFIVPATDTSSPTPTPSIRTTASAMRRCGRSRCSRTWATRWSAPSLITAPRARDSIRPSCPTRRPPGAKANGLPSGYIYEQSNGNSIYHGATFQIMRRFRNGVSANAIYTYSKAIDNAVQAQNYLDTAAERALSASSRTHVLNLSWQYSSGRGPRRRHAGQRLEGRGAQGLDASPTTSASAADCR